jgi:UDP-N-acetylmuramoyl-L-alanyl-D-glutamate--2,6-diaminopimelate ligase
LTADAVPEVAISGLSVDSRRVAPGDAFVALRGGSGHGMRFAADALASGAAAIVDDGFASPPADFADRCVTVPGLADLLPVVARRFWDAPDESLEIDAVTGTNGKSSVAWLLAQALDGAMIGTLGVGTPGALAAGQHTTPDTVGLYRALARLRDTGFRRVVLEASSHALDQRRTAGLRFRTAMFTNLGRDHLDYHGSMEAYGRAKARLFEEYASRHQIINADDAFGRELVASLSGSGGLIRYGMDKAHTPEVLGVIRNVALDGMQLDVNTPIGRICCSSRLVGRINAVNLTLVVANLVARGYCVRDIADIVARLTPVPGRMNGIDGPAGQRVIIDYAHTPDALAGALSALRELTPGRLFCVFGCGGDRDRGKRPEMGRIAESCADEVILTNDNPRHEEPLRILRDIQQGMARPDRARVVPDRAEAIEAAVYGAGPNDCVLVAGKGHERTQDFGSRVAEFSDFDAVRNAMTEAA